MLIILSFPSKADLARLFYYLGSDTVWRRGTGQLIRVLADMSSAAGLNSFGAAVRL